MSDLIHAYANAASVSLESIAQKSVWTLTNDWMKAFAAGIAGSTFCEDTIHDLFLGRSGIPCRLADAAWREIENLDATEFYLLCPTNVKGLGYFCNGKVLGFRNAASTCTLRRSPLISYVLVLFDRSFEWTIVLSEDRRSPFFAERWDPVRDRYDDSTYL